MYFMCKKCCNIFLAEYFSIILTVQNIKILIRESNILCILSIKYCLCFVIFYTMKKATGKINQLLA